MKDFIEIESLLGSFIININNITTVSGDKKGVQIYVVSETNPLNFSIGIDEFKALVKKAQQIK